MTPALPQQSSWYRMRDEPPDELTPDEIEARAEWREHEDELRIERYRSMA